MTSGLSSNEVVCLEQPADALINKTEGKPAGSLVSRTEALASVGRMDTNLLAQAGTNKFQPKLAKP